MTDAAHNQHSEVVSSPPVQKCCAECTICLEIGERCQIPGVHSFVSTAEAIIGRPLTPMSYAGVARRTPRRCAVGVYYC
jgi:hypothetical protein